MMQWLQNSLTTKIVSWKQSKCSMQVDWPNNLVMDASLVPPQQWLELTCFTLRWTLSQRWLMHITRQSIMFMVGDPQLKDKLALELTLSLFQFLHKLLILKITRLYSSPLSTTRVVQWQRMVQLLLGVMPRTVVWFILMELLSLKIKYCQLNSHLTALYTLLLVRIIWVLLLTRDLSWLLVAQITANLVTILFNLQKKKRQKKKLDTKRLVTSPRMSNKRELFLMSLEILEASKQSKLHVVSSIL